MNITALSGHVDDDGNGVFEVTVDPDHGAEVIGGLLAGLALNAAEIIQLRGLTRSQVLHAIAHGMEAIINSELQHSGIQIAQTVQ